MKKLFVGGLPWATDDQGLAAEFAHFGKVREAKVVTDRETGRSRGFGFVSFDDDTAADEAIRQMNGATIGGRTVNVNEAREREHRPSGGGGGHSGGGHHGGGRGGGREDRGRRRRDRDAYND